MSRIKRLLRPAPQRLNWKAALPVFGLTAALIAGCAQVPAAPPVATTSVPSKAQVRFDTCARPVYPQASLREKHTGDVVMRFLIGADGKVQDSKVDSSSGDVALDDAAHTAIAKCTFTPALKDGVAVPAWTMVRYVWTLS